MKTENQDTRRFSKIANSKSNTFKNILAIFVIPYMAFAFAKSHFPASVGRVTSLGNEVLQHLNLVVSHQFNRSFSTVQHGKLPTHFTLPSGDKIPSIALGVWKASPADVKGAVKVLSTQLYISTYS